GNPDLIVTTGGSSGAVSVLLGTAAGTFAAPIIYAAGAGTNSVTAADVNGDGKLDLVVANRLDATVSVLLNTSTPASSLDAASLARASGRDPGLAVDATAPAAPAAPVLADDTGASHLDRITSDPALSYPTPAQGDTLLYSLDGGAYATVAPVITGD